MEFEGGEKKKIECFSSLVFVNFLKKKNSKNSKKTPFSPYPDPSPAASTSTSSLAPAGKGSTSAALRSAEEIAAAEEAPAAAAAAAAVFPTKRAAVAVALFFEAEDEDEEEEGCAPAFAAAASHGSKVAAMRGREAEEELLPASLEEFFAFCGDDEDEAFVVAVVAAAPLSSADAGRRKKEAALLLLLAAVSSSFFSPLPEGEAEVAESPPSSSLSPSLLARALEELLLLPVAVVVAGRGAAPSGLPLASPPLPKNAKTRLSPGRAPAASQRAEAMMLARVGRRRRSCGLVVEVARGGEDEGEEEVVFPGSFSLAPSSPSWRKIVSSREKPKALAIALRTHSASLTAPGKPRGPEPTATNTARRREGRQALSSLWWRERGRGRGVAADAAAAEEFEVEEAEE